MADDFNIHAPGDQGVGQAGDNYARLIAAGVQARAQQQSAFSQNANMLQHAQAMQVAKGQSASSGSSMGTSPITQSIMKAKQLATSTLDQDSLTDDQKRGLQQMTNDPNVDYRTHLQAIEQLRQGQGIQQRQSNFDTRQQGMQERQQQNMAYKTGTKNLQDASTQERAAMKQRDAAQKQMDALGVKEQAFPGEDPQLAAIRSQRDAAQQAMEAAQKTHDQHLSDLSNMSAGGDGTEDQQHGAEFGGGGSKAMEQAGYARGTASVTRAGSGSDRDTSYPFDGPQGQQQAQGKGKMTVDHAKAYLQQAGGDRAKAQALAKKDGWSW